MIETYQILTNMIYGYVHKYETMLWTLEKLRKKIFVIK